MFPINRHKESDLFFSKESKQRLKQALTQARKDVKETILRGEHAKNEHAAASIIKIADEAYKQLKAVPTGPAALGTIFTILSEYHTKALESAKFFTELKEQQEGELCCKAIRRLYNGIAPVVCESLFETFDKTLKQEMRRRYSAPLNALFRHFVLPLKSLKPGDESNSFLSSRLRDEAIKLLSGQTNIESDDKLKLMLESFHSALPGAKIFSTDVAPSSAPLSRLGDAGVQPPPYSPHAEPQPPYAPPMSGEYVRAPQAYSPPQPTAPPAYFVPPTHPGLSSDAPRVAQSGAMFTLKRILERLPSIEQFKLNWILQRTAKRLGSNGADYLGKRTGGLSIRLVRTDMNQKERLIHGSKSTMSPEKLCSLFQKPQEHPVLAQHIAYADRGNLERFLGTSLVKSGNKHSEAGESLLEWVHQRLVAILQNNSGRIAFAAGALEEQLCKREHSSLAVPMLPPVLQEGEPHYAIIHNELAHAATPLKPQDIHFSAVLVGEDHGKDKFHYTPLGTLGILVGGHVKDDLGQPIADHYLTFSSMPKGVINQLGNMMLVDPGQYGEHDKEIVSAGQEFYTCLSRQHNLLISVVLTPERTDPQPTKTDPRYHRSGYTRPAGANAVYQSDYMESEDIECDGGSPEEFQGPGGVSGGLKVSSDSAGISELTLQKSSQKIDVRRAYYEQRLGKAYKLKDARMTVMKVLALPPSSHLRELYEALPSESTLASGQVQAMDTSQREDRLVSLLLKTAEETMLHLQAATGLRGEPSRLSMASEHQSEIPPGNATSESFAKLLEKLGHLGVSPPSTEEAAPSPRFASPRP